MRKDDSGLREWCKHTGNVCGGRRRINRVGRLNVKRHLQKVEKELEMDEINQLREFIKELEYQNAILKHDNIAQQKEIKKLECENKRFYKDASCLWAMQAAGVDNWSGMDEVKWPEEDDEEDD